MKPQNGPILLDNCQLVRERRLACLSYDRVNALVIGSEANLATGLQALAELRTIVMSYETLRVGPRHRPGGRTWGHHRCASRAASDLSGHSLAFELCLTPGGTDRSLAFYVDQLADRDGRHVTHNRSVYLQARHQL